MDRDLLTAFEAFARVRNLTHAAADLGISQPTMFARIQRLSDLVQVPLYVRHGRSLQLTEAGARLATFARAQLAEQDRFLADVRDAWTDRPVVLGAGAGSYLYLLGDALQGFRQAALAPMALLTLSADDALAGVRAHEIDLAFTSLLAPPADLEVTHVLDVRMSVLLPQAHPLAAHRALTLQHLHGQRLVAPPRGRPARKALEASLARADVQVDIAVEAQGWALLRHFVGLGLGLAVVNDFCPPPRGCVARPLPQLAARPYQLIRRIGGLEHPATTRLAAMILGDLRA